MEFRCNLFKNSLHNNKVSMKSHTSSVILSEGCVATESKFCIA